MDMYEWINYYKSNHLVINDLKKMNVGDTLDVVIFDRNFEEYFIWPKLKKNKSYTPKYFFKGNRHQIKYNGDLTWDITYSFGCIAHHPIEINVSKFDLGFTWYPLTGENMILNTKIVNNKTVKLPKKNQLKIHWTDFPKNTSIGWRGPIMLWKNINNTTKIMWSLN